MRIKAIVVLASLLAPCSFLVGPGWAQVVYSGPNRNVTDNGFNNPGAFRLFGQVASWDRIALQVEHYDHEVITSTLMGWNYQGKPGKPISTDITAERFVDVNNPTPVAPYTSWATAANTIQDAVDAALTGTEIIWVTNGVYEVGGRPAPGMLLINRVYIHKPVSIRSMNGAAHTIIRGSGPLGDAAVRCVWMTNGAELVGFTLTNGHTRTGGSSDDYLGAGVWAPSTNATVSDSIITGNRAIFAAGAWFGTFNHSQFSHNTAINLGGGAQYSILNNCLVAGNTAVEGGGVRFCTLNHCTVTENSAVNSGGAIGGAIRNSIIYFNQADSLPDINGGSIHYSAIPVEPGGPDFPLYFGTNNITNAPVFVDPASGNYRLLAGSPGLDAGSNDDVVLSTDLDGKPRIAGGVTDMGAYELELRALTIESAHSGAVPPAGINWFHLGTPLTNRVAGPVTSGTTRFTVAGWSLAGHASSSGTNAEAIFVLTNNATLTWLWATQYWLTAQSGSHGSVDPSGGWYDDGTTATVTAVPDAYYAFDQWSDDASGNVHPLDLVMDEAKVVTASFRALYTTHHPTPLWWLAGYGITNDVEVAVGDDADSDGVETWREFVMDTDPTDLNSYLRFINMETAFGTNCWEVVWTNDVPPYEIGTNVECEVIGHILSWSVSTQRVYDLYSASGLYEPWLPMPGMTNFVPTTSILTITNHLPGPDLEFLRINVRPE